VIKNKSLSSKYFLSISKHIVVICENRLLRSDAGYQSWCRGKQVFVRVRYSRLFRAFACTSKNTRNKLPFNLLKFLNVTLELIIIIIFRSPEGSTVSKFGAAKLTVFGAVAFAADKKKMTQVRSYVLNKKK
jgi:hypothetical protein